jgi:hypothetical protein
MLQKYELNKEPQEGGTVRMDDKIAVLWQIKVYTQL